MEIYRNEAGEWIATAVQHGVTAKGVSETDALARLTDALRAHLKSGTPR